MDHVSDLLPTIVKPELKPLSRIQQRLLVPPDDDARSVYLHSVLCQTMMPYRNPGDDVRVWEKENGFVSLVVKAGETYEGPGRGWRKVGLPYGPKPRLVLYHLNAEAIRTESPFVDLKESLTAFVGRALRLDSMGRNMRVVKDQLTRLASSDFRLGMMENGQPVTVKGTVIQGFRLWKSDDQNQRNFWPDQVAFSREYFDSLIQHAVPLNEIAVGMLSHSAMGLDIYAWLAQRLHRINPQKPAFVPWTSLHTQFGDGYERLRDFRRVFWRTLTRVQIAYREARFTVDDKGMTLSNSRPPVLKQFLQIK